MNKQKIKLTIAQHKKLFKRVKFLTYYEVIDDPQNSDIYIYRRIRFPVRVLALLLSPLVIFIGGVLFFFYAVSEQKKSFKEFKNRTGRKF